MERQPIRVTRQDMDGLALFNGKITTRGKPHNTENQASYLVIQPGTRLVLLPPREPSTDSKSTKRQDHRRSDRQQRTQSTRPTVSDPLSRLQVPAPAMARRRDSRDEGPFCRSGPVLARPYDLRRFVWRVGPIDPGCQGLRREQIG